MDLSNLTPVPSGTSRRKNKYDLRYKDGGEKGTPRFRLSQNAFTILGLSEDRGVTVRKHPSGAVLLSVQEEDNSHHFKRRGDSKKGLEFTNHNLRNLLDAAGFAGEDYFGLYPVGNNDKGVSFYHIKPWDTNSDSPLISNVVNTSNGSTTTQATESVEANDSMEEVVDEDEDEDEDVEDVETPSDEVVENPFA